MCQIVKMKDNSFSNRVITRDYVRVLIVYPSVNTNQTIYVKIWFQTIQRTGFLHILLLGQFMHFFWVTKSLCRFDQNSWCMLYFSSSQIRWFTLKILILETFNKSKQPSQCLFILLQFENVDKSDKLGRFSFHCPLSVDRHMPEAHLA